MKLSVKRKFTHRLFAAIMASLIAASISCGLVQSESAKYAIQAGLSNSDVDLLKDIQFDNNAKLLMDELAALPKDMKSSSSVMDYLKRAAQDNRITDSELSTQDTIKAINTVKSVSDDTLQMYLRYGIDDSVTEYISFVSSLPKDFADYAIKNKLCIQDRQLTNLERTFLKNPEQYSQQLFDFNMSEIAKTDSEFVNNLEKVPYFKDKTVKTNEALEDMKYLVDSGYKSGLEKVYGKGIQRKMWSVALERLIYKAFNDEFDANNPFGKYEWPIYSKLAEFQEKYNKEMDKDGISGPKPAIRGMNYFDEPQYFLMKNEDEIKLDYALMKWALRCNSVRIWASLYDSSFKHVEFAQGEGLEVWLQFSPLFGASEIKLGEYKERLRDFTSAAQKNSVGYLMVGNEFDVWWKSMGGYTSSNLDNFAARKSGSLKSYVNDLVTIVRPVFAGKVTYADWGAYWNLIDDINWNSLDFVSVNIYMHDGTNEDRFYNAILSTKNRYNKPLIISETGAQAIKEAGEAGGDYTYRLRKDVHYDPIMQANIIDIELKLVYKAAVDGVFIFSWDAPAHSSYDANREGFGIWDYVDSVPKPSFWVVYKYFRD